VTQFIQLQKLTTASAASAAPFLFNFETFLFSEIVSMLDASTGAQITPTRVTLAAVPEYSFNTLVLPTQLAGAFLSFVNVTGALTPGGSSCAGDPGVLDLELVASDLPILYVNRIINNVASEKKPFYCNLNYLLYAEQTPYRDEATGAQAFATTMVFHSSAPRKHLCDIAFTDLSTLIDPLVL
jgi:hypothetical protein